MIGRFDDLMITVVRENIGKTAAFIGTWINGWIHWLPDLFATTAGGPMCE